jgi:hypothetical protein
MRLLTGIAFSKRLSRPLANRAGFFLFVKMMKSGATIARMPGSALSIAVQGRGDPEGKAAIGKANPALMLAIGAQPGKTRMTQKPVRWGITA